MKEVVKLFSFICLVLFPIVAFSAENPSEERGGRVKEYAIPTQSSNPVDIAIDASDNIWFTEQNSNKIGKFIQSAQKFEEFEIPYKGSPVGIAIDANSIIWVAMSIDNSIISFSPLEKKFKRYKVPTSDAAPYDITVGSDAAVWFTERDGNKIGRLNTKNGLIKEYPIPTAGSQLSGIAQDKEGIIWFIESGGNKLGSLDPDKDSRIWFTENRGNRVGVFDPIQSVFTEYDVPTYRSLPLGIAVDSKGVVWFTETDRDANKIGRIEPSVITHTDNGKAMVTTEVSNSRSLQTIKTIEIIKIIATIIVVLFACVMIWYILRKKRGSSNE
ncbi:MAG: hypothetical protein HZB54_05485 [Deltaproteobacteria bacterium]|nr:hypothetical protein [Deltaproteobacteria bacterium]